MIVGRYAPGPWQAVVTGRGLVVLGADVPITLLESVWRQADAGRGLPAVIEALTGAFGTSLAAIPPFAVVLAEEDSVRAVVRGAFELTVETATGVEELSGATVTTWTERTIPGAVRANIVTAEHDAPVEYPIRDGIVLVSAVTVTFDGADAAPVAPPELHAARGATPEPQAARVATPPAAGFGAGSGTDTPEGAASRDANPPQTPDAGGVEPGVEPEPQAQAQPEPAAGAQAQGQPQAQPAAAAGAEAGALATPAAVEAPGIIDSAAVTMAGADTLLPADSTFARAAVTGDSASAETSADPAEGDSVWAATVVRPTDATGPAPAPAAGDHDGETISLAQARALRGAADSDSMPPPLAPPRRTAPGRIRLSTGQELLLDRTVVIGRRPRSTRVVGTDLPHLVAVASPEQDISRSHLELRVEGDSIVATDLNTTNGTILHRAGADPVRLHPGEATVVVSGDLLDLGDGITVTVEETA
ncbi:FHA domain-containing protein [Microbacterium sp. NPDC055910]|uniref:FHA domain-containing protein n=1 Tax=Microbacterium sp. NPDC055910 TaxID=3345659 RepID=UPI0035E19BFB